MFGFVKESDYQKLVAEKECFEQELNITQRIIAEQMERVRGLLEKIEELQREPSSVHNERGAGRKRIATGEQVSQVLALHDKGYSLSQIARELNVPWSKSTMKNIIDRTKVKK